MNESSKGFVPPQNPDWKKPNKTSVRVSGQSLNVARVDEMFHDALNGDNKTEIDFFINAADKIADKLQNSFRDKLTNCRNRAYFEEVKSEFEKDFDPGRSNNQVAFVFADLNSLKLINDAMGHEQGDNAIVGAARFLKENFRRGDHVYRIGGDEFVVVCKNNENDPDFENNLIKKTTSEKFKNSPVSMAFGVAVFDEKKDKSFDDTLRRADELMYRNKLYTKSKSDNLMIANQLIENNKG